MCALIRIDIRNKKEQADEKNPFIPTDHCNNYDTQQSGSID